MCTCTNCEIMHTILCAYLYYLVKSPSPMRCRAISFSFFGAEKWKDRTSRAFVERMECEMGTEHARDSSLPHRMIETKNEMYRNVTAQSVRKTQPPGRRHFVSIHCCSRLARLGSARLRSASVGQLHTLVWSCMRMCCRHMANMENALHTIYGKLHFLLMCIRF